MRQKGTLPRELSVIVTYRCPMKCVMCNTHAHPSDPQREIMPGDLERLPQLQFINITGGEPFIREELPEFVKLLYTKAPRIVISTSGWFDERVIRLAGKFPGIGIRVSLEGMAAVNDRLRGREGSFARGLGLLKTLRKMGLRDIGFGITLSGINSADMLALYDLSCSLGMEFATAAVHNSFYFHKEDNRITDTQAVCGDLEELINRLLKAHNPKSWFRAYFNLGLIRYVLGGSRLLPCEAGSTNFFIDPYGEVYPCNGLQTSTWLESMGNIRAGDSFEALWCSAQAESVRYKVAACPKHCWMIGTAAPVMKKYLYTPLVWVLFNKIRVLLGMRADISSAFKGKGVDR